MRKDQSGVMLLEAMIAILIFSLGILGIVGMQAMAIAASRDAKFRADADLLANELIGEMRIADRDANALKERFQSGAEATETTTAATATADGAAYTDWRTNRVDKTLPGVDVYKPIVEFITLGTRPAGKPSTPTEVVVTVRWCAPNEKCDNNREHRHQVVAQIY